MQENDGGQKFSCYHLAGTDINPQIKGLIAEGSLSFNPAGCGVCDRKIPPFTDMLSGQDITCYGADNCCDPGHVEWPSEERA